MRLRRSLSALPVAAGLMLGLLAASPPASAGQTVCQRLTGGFVASTLGLKVGGESTTIQGDVAVCWYRVGANSHGVSVRVQTHDSAAGFASDRKMAGTYGESPKTDTHFSPYPAFSTSLGSPSYGVTYSVTVLKSKTELQVSGAGTTLARIEALAHHVLSLL